MADTIVIETPVATVLEVSGKQGPQGVPGATGATGATGPQGPAGTGIEVLTQKGDLLSRNDSTGIRVGIGSTGQVLKVSAQGLPTWANESGAVSSVNGATGAVTVAAAQHAVEHEFDGADPIQAKAALVTTDVAALNGVYFWDGTTTSGRPNFFRTGTRKNTKIVYNSNTNQWNLVRNLTVEAVGVDGPSTVPWGNSWEEFVTPTSVSVTQLPLETMVQKLAETGGAATATTSEDGLMSSADKTKLNGIAANATANTASSATPSALGTAAAGSATDYARADHTHSAEVSDTAFRVLGSTDATKKVALEVDTNVPTGTTVTLTAPSSGGTIALAGDAPAAHKASHATGGTDALAPSDIGAQSIFTTELLVVTADQTLIAARAKNYAVQNYGSGPFNLTLPIANNLAGDVVVIRVSGTFVSDVVIRRQNYGSQGGGPQFTTLATLIGGGPSDQQYRFIKADSNDFAGWSLVPVDTHTHTASAITSGTLDIARIPTGTTSTTVALGNHSHELTALAATGATNGHVLTANGSGGVTFAAASGGVSAVDSTTADVFSVSGSNLVADDGGLIDSANPFVQWNDTSNKLVYANPLSRPSGAFYVGVAPTTTALGTDAINIQPSRAAATQVASGQQTVNIGVESTASGSRCIALGWRASSTGTDGVVVGRSSSAAQQAACFGSENTASGLASVAVGNAVTANAQDSVAIGSYGANDNGLIATAIRAVGLNAIANMRGMLATRPFNAVYWGGQTTNNTATILNLDATATNRFTIAANTALAVDILLVARRSDVADKWLVARRFLGIRRDGSNNTSLIGTVQNFGMTDQSGGSPTWSFALTADDTNDALQLEVTGATGETVQWRACAIYRVV